MSILNRAPGGKFCSSGSALVVWLPELLSRYCGNELIALLDTSQIYCAKQSANLLTLNARSHSGVGNRGDLRWWGLRQAQKWEQRRNVLLKAIKELEGIE